MTTEHDFQAALDANTADWQTRLVLADWLQERGDPRADGYRALGTLRWRPWFDGAGRRQGEAGWWAFAEAARASHSPRHHGPNLLPPDWYLKLQPKNQMPGWGDSPWCYFRSRRECEDAAALAFAELSPERRSELLTAPPTTKKRKKPTREEPPAKKSKDKKPGARKPTAQKPKGKKK